MKKEVLTNLFSQWDNVEGKLHVQIIDTLAKEYGWTIDYIQSLSLPEISTLLHIIKERNTNADLVTQINIAKGMSGKISPNTYGKPKEDNESVKEDELKNLQNLAKKLKLKVNTVKE
jgi:hypothetical protein